jgi:hypothetical protein
MFDDFEREGVTALSEFDRHRLCRRCGAMLDGEGEIIAVAAQIEIGVPPGVELGGAAQRLTGADTATTLLGVMDDEHGDAMPALQLAQVGEQRGDLAAGVLVDAVETYEWIEDEQARLQSGDGLGEVAAVGIQIEPDGRRGDDLDVENLSRRGPFRSRQAILVRRIGRSLRRRYARRRHRRDERSDLDRQLPHTDKLRVIERFHIVNGGKTLQVDVHVEDPGAFTMPWNTVQRYDRVEQGPLAEFSCAENRFNLGEMDPMPEAKTPDF